MKVSVLMKTSCDRQSLGAYDDRMIVVFLSRNHRMMQDLVRHRHGACDHRAVGKAAAVPDEMVEEAEASEAVSV